MLTNTESGIWICGIDSDADWINISADGSSVCPGEAIILSIVCKRKQGAADAFSIVRIHCHKLIPFFIGFKGGTVCADLFGMEIIYSESPEIGRAVFLAVDRTHPIYGVWLYNRKRRVVVCIGLGLVNEMVAQQQAVAQVGLILNAAVHKGTVLGGARER